MTQLAPLRARWPTSVVLGLPVLLVLGAYAWLAAAHGTLLLWPVVVHESGRYTLGETVFFVRHFLRELPIDVAMGLFCAAGAAAAEPGGRRRPVLALAAATLAVAVAALGLAGAIGQEGRQGALRDLLQYRTRDDDLAYGAHWSFHLLSTLWFGAAAPLAAGLWAGAGGPVRPRGQARLLMAVAWGWTVLLTGVFGLRADAFTSARYIGHQAREILTHGLITLPLVVGILRVVAGRPRQAVRYAPPARILRGISWLGVVGIPLFLVVSFRGAALADTAQMASGLAGLVAAHVFEHVLDYLFVALVALAGFSALRAAPAEQPGQ